MQVPSNGRGLVLANNKDKNDDVISSPKIPERGPSGSGKRQLDEAAIIVLQRRIEQAKAAGAVNIAVNVDFLLEVLGGYREATLKAGWKSRMEI